MHRLKSFLLKKRKLLLRLVAVILVIAVCFGLFTVYDNFRLDVEYIPVSSDKIPHSFDGFRIAHISDYHSRKSSLIEKQLLDTLNEEKPDIIVVTGDLMDCRSVDTATAISFARKLTEITDVYFVTGNHESNFLFADQWGYIAFMDSLRATGVKVLTNETVTLQASDGSCVYLHGIDDPYLTKDRVDIKHATDDMCAGLVLDDGFNILLAHHPEQLDIYSKYGFDLVLSGHAHGGQITLFGLGIFAPDQEIFPKYTSGLYEKESTKLVLSRGIGYSFAPLRFFCSPHLIITELSSQ